MLPRERVIRAIEFNEPDRIPNGCYWLPAANKNEAALRKIFERYPKDFADIGYYFEHYQAYHEGTYRDKWGCVWKNTYDGIIGQVIEHPLENATLEDIKNYEPPSPDEVLNFDTVEKNLSNPKIKEKYILGSIGNFFQRVFYLRGFEKTLLELTLGRKEISTLIEKVYKHVYELTRRWLELDIDGLILLDDWGTNDRLFVRPEIWRKYFKKYYASIFAEIKKSGKHVFFHSDGYVVDIIPDLIEIGVDALNVQVALIGIDTLSRLCKGKICILADIDRQRLLPFGKPEEVKEHVKQIIRGLGLPTGGLIAWGEIGPDVPLENVEAMLQAFFEYDIKSLR